MAEEFQNRRPCRCRTQHRTFHALLLDPWVRFGLGGRVVVSECEECEGDEGFGSVEAECDSGEESDLGVGRLDEGVGQPGVEGVIDRHSVLHDLAGELDEGRHAGASCPRQPPLEGVLAGVALDGKHESQSFLEEVGAMEPRVDLGDPVELGALVVGEITRGTAARWG